MSLYVKSTWIVLCANRMVCDGPQKYAVLSDKPKVPPRCPICGYPGIVEEIPDSVNDFLNPTKYWSIPDET